MVNKPWGLHSSSSKKDGIRQDRFLSPDSHDRLSWAELLRLQLQQRSDHMRHSYQSFTDKREKSGSADIKSETWRRFLGKAPVGAAVTQQRRKHFSGWPTFSIGRLEKSGMKDLQPHLHLVKPLEECGFVHNKAHNLRQAWQNDFISKST